MCVYANATMSWCTCGQNATCGSLFSPCTMYVLGIELRSSGRAAIVFIHWAT